jgi:hypothetical protein
MKRRPSRFWVALIAIVIAGFGIRMTSMVLWAPTKVPEKVILGCTVRRIFSLMEKGS